MYINRTLKLATNLEEGRILVLYGPRQCGKSTLVKKYLETCPYRYSYETATLRSVQEKFLNGPQKSLIDDYGSQFDLVVIDEAQLIPNIGENAKAMVDLYPKLRVLLTGSSSFELSGQVGEPLLGRQNVLTLFPLWETELKDAGLVTPGEFLKEALVFGAYPGVVTENSHTKKIRRLQGLAGGNLFKDILAFDRLKKPQVLMDLLSLLAYQMGNEVSLSELATQLGVDQNTVERYLNLLEQSFILFPLRAFSRNARKELRTKKKYYFYDLGIRNTIINNFDPPHVRTDLGALWENYCIIERMKRNTYTENWVQPYFWRSFTGSEIDYLELANGELSAYEFKWNPKKTARVPTAFNESYHPKLFQVINPANRTDFVG